MIDINAIPIATLIIDPRYDWLLIFNAFLSITGICIFNFEGKINRLFQNNNIDLTCMNIIEIIIRILAVVNLGFFFYQYFTEDLFLVQERLINYQG